MSIEKPSAGTRGAKPPPRLLARLLMPIMEKVHRRSGDKFGGFDVLYLHTVGARSGERRTSTVARLDDGKGGCSSSPPTAARSTTRPGTTTSSPTPARCRWSTAGGRSG